MKVRRNAAPVIREDPSGAPLPIDAVSGFYPELVRELPVGVVLLLLEEPSDAETFKIVDANRAAAKIFKSDSQSLLGKKLAHFPKLLRTEIPGQLLATLRAGHARDLGEISCSDDRGQMGIYSVRAFPLSNYCLGVACEDVTDRKHIERILRDSEERLRLLIESIQEYAIFRLDTDGNVVSWNAGAQRLKGYDSKEIIGKHFSVFYPQEDLSNDKPRKMLAQATEFGQTKDEGWRIRKDGSRFWANVVVTALRDPKGNLLGFAKLTRDVTDKREEAEALARTNELLELRVAQRTAVLTRVNLEMRTEIAERQRVEEQLTKSRDQLRDLAARLQSVREQERTSIAREIHDELGQACTAVKMDLVLIGHKLSKNQTRLRTKVDAAIQLVDSTIGSLRRIAFELRPRTLDDLGLPAALESQAEEFQARTGIRCSLSLPREQLVLDTDLATAIFRIFQESLTNVARHAHATRVEARLKHESGRLIFEVSDNGTGFDPEAAKAGKSLGLVGMQERALLLNGDFKTEGVPAAGTTVTLTLPFPRSTTKDKDTP